MLTQIITDPVVAISKAGNALADFTAIRDSTLPGTPLWTAADKAVDAITDAVTELWRPTVERSET